MTWEVGQKVAIVPRYRVVPEEGYQRQTIVKLYANGGFKLDDGTRWTAWGRKYGSGHDRWGAESSVRAIQDIIKEEIAGMLEATLLRLQREVRDAAAATTDIDRLERALAVLNEDKP